MNSLVVDFEQSLGNQQSLIETKDMVISMAEINVLLAFLEETNPHI